MKTFKSIAFLFSFCLLFSIEASAQQPVRLEFNGPVRFTLGLTEKKEFVFDGKKGDYWEVVSGDENSGSLFFELYSPNGEELLEKQNGLAEALVLPKDGRYVLKAFIAKESTPEGNNGPFEMTFTVSDRFALPKGSKLVSSKTVSGHEINVYRSEENFSTALEILKEGNRLVYLLGDSMIPFEVNDGIPYGNSAAAKREKALWKVADKTGDGVPDVAIQFYSGGAHCCYDYYFFELGSEVILRPAINTADAGMRAKRVVPGAGLRLETADMTFAYWNIHFAGSPSATVVIDFKDGRWRPNFSAMNQPPPSPAKLKAMAVTARRLINNKPYGGDEFAGIQGDGYLFEEAFWGTMLDLIYTGNEREAWKYFDDVWPKTKPGKERFAQDFKEQLGKSEFWRMILEDQGVKTKAAESALDERIRKYVDSVTKN